MTSEEASATSLQKPALASWKACHTWPPALREEAPTTFVSTIHCSVGPGMLVLTVAAATPTVDITESSANPVTPTTLRVTSRAPDAARAASRCTSTRSGCSRPDSTAAAPAARTPQPTAEPTTLMAPAMAEPVLSTPRAAHAAPPLASHCTRQPRSWSSEASPSTGPAPSAADRAHAAPLPGGYSKTSLPASTVSTVAAVHWREKCPLPLTVSVGSSAEAPSKGRWHRSEPAATRSPPRTAAAEWAPAPSADRSTTRHWRALRSVFPRAVRTPIALVLSVVGFWMHSWCCSIGTA
mmetsp:Transcript_128336/g.348350  ORF Transcript_128336/g.348350 Transcript_128336/m.348350 type:complete len:295 (-) Transcript_128336:8-892(-)